MRRLLLVLVLAVAGFGLGWTAAAYAAEQRCTDLGSNCVCSEPMNTATYSAMDWSTGGACTGANGCWWNPSDSVTQQCVHEGNNAPITTYNDFTPSNDATALSRLPSGHAVTRFPSRASGHSGIFSIGSDNTVLALGNQFMKRMSMRAYVYHSSNYNFRDDTPPCHSKFLQGNVGSWHWENFVGPIHMYDFFGSNWGPSSIFPRDCCFGNPGDELELTKANWRDRWFRVEAVVINRAGGASPNGVRFILYMTDVSNGITKLNGGNTFVASDWRGVGAGGPQDWLGWDFITSNPAQRPVMLNFYREVSPGGGQCNGFRGASHMMVAGWNTDEGQIIGSAAEVEGGTVLPSPAAPSNLNVTEAEVFRRVAEAEKARVPKTITFASPIRVEGIGSLALLLAVGVVMLVRWRR